MITGKDGRRYRVFCNRCNVEQTFSVMQRCQRCGDVEFRLIEVKRKRAAHGR